MQKFTNKISEKWDVFRIEWCYIYHIFDVRMIIKKRLAKERQRCTSFMNMENAYDKDDW